MVRGSQGCPQNARVVDGKAEKVPNHEFIYSVINPDPKVNVKFADGRL